MANPIAGNVPGLLDLRINKGEDFDATLTYNNDAGQPINLTGYTARAYIKTSIDAADPPALPLTTSNGRITLGGAAGTIRLQIDDAITDTLSLVATTDPEVQQGVWDLEIVTGGVSKKIVKGLVFAYKQVTTGTV